jgi:hypothetical protein
MIFSKMFILRCRQINKCPCNSFISGNNGTGDKLISGVIVTGKNITGVIVTGENNRRCHGIDENPGTRSNHRCQ